LVRIPGTIISKCGQAVKVVQRWDSQRPAINYLLRDFGRWLINEHMKKRLVEDKKACARTVNTTANIWWIEKLLQTPIDDYRKFVLWRILAQYLIKIRECSADVAFDIINNWLDTCRRLRQLDFRHKYTSLQ
jgi:hypothetical protein